MEKVYPNKHLVGYSRYTKKTHKKENLPILALKTQPSKPFLLYSHTYCSLFLFINLLGVMLFELWSLDVSWISNLPYTNNVSHPSVQLCLFLLGALSTCIGACVIWLDRWSICNDYSKTSLESSHMPVEANYSKCFYHHGHAMILLFFNEIIPWKQVTSDGENPNISCLWKQLITQKQGQPSTFGNPPKLIIWATFKWSLHDHDRSICNDNFMVAAKKFRNIGIGKAKLKFLSGTRIFIRSTLIPNQMLLNSCTFDFPEWLRAWFTCLLLNYFGTHCFTLLLKLCLILQL